MVNGLLGTTIKFVAFAVVAILLFMLLVNTMQAGIDDAQEYHAEFVDVGGLAKGDDVKVAGVKVGKVTDIQVGDAEDGLAEVAFELEKDQPLYDTTQIVMRYANLIGQRYLSLVPRGSSTNEVPAGETIPVSRTNPGFDLTGLLNGFRPLFQVIKPDEINRLATSMVKVLQGESGTVEQLLQQTSSLTNHIADRDVVIGEVLDNLTPVLNDLAGQGTELTTTVRELKSLMQGLARDRKSIGASISGVSQLVGSTAELLRELRQPASATLAEFREVAKVAAGTKEELNEALRSFRATFTHLARVTSYENALNVYPCTVYLTLGKGLTLNFGGGQGPWSEVCET